MRDLLKKLNTIEEQERKGIVEEYYFGSKALISRVSSRLERGMTTVSVDGETDGVRATARLCFPECGNNGYYITKKGIIKLFIHYKKFQMSFKRLQRRVEKNEYN